MRQAKLAEYTENEVARRFARRACDSLMYNHSSHSWYVWDGSVWSIDKTGAAIELIRQFIEAERESAIGPRERVAMGRVRFLNAVDEVAAVTHCSQCTRGSWTQIFGFWALRREWSTSALALYNRVDRRIGSRVEPR